MAKHLGRVPIPGSAVEVGGLLFRAEEAKGRRNRIGTVLITVVRPDAATAPAPATPTTPSTPTPSTDHPAEASRLKA
jgi:hypothetical protein